MELNKDEVLENLIEVDLQPNYKQVDKKIIMMANFEK